MENSVPYALMIGYLSREGQMCHIAVSSLIRWSNPTVGAGLDEYGALDSSETVFAFLFVLFSLFRLFKLD